jgi:hypothetical protein
VTRGDGGGGRPGLGSATGTNSAAQSGQQLATQQARAKRACETRILFFPPPLCDFRYTVRFRHGGGDGIGNGFVFAVLVHEGNATLETSGFRMGRAHGGVWMHSPSPFLVRGGDGDGLGRVDDDRLRQADRQGGRVWRTRLPSLLPVFTHLGVIRLRRVLVVPTTTTVIRETCPVDRWIN